MHNIRTIRTLILGASCALLLNACGGGGGDSGITYTGAATPAAITAGNGEEVATSAYTNGEGGAALGNIFAASIRPADGSGGDRLNIAAATQRMVEIVSKVNLTTTQNPSSNRTIISEEDSFNGSCGGSAQFNITIDDSSGNFNGNFTFTNFCEDGDTINGQMNISGNTGQSGLMTMSFSNLTFSASSDSATINGTITTYPDAIPMVITTNMKIKDNNTNKTFWADNYVTTIYTVTAGEEMLVNGRFYHPDFGYADLTTPTRFYIANSDEWPSSGSMVATGLNQSKVKLTAISNTTYNYEVDADGNGVYETQQLGLLWNDL